MHYAAGRLEDVADTDLNQCKAFGARPDMTWIDVQGIPESATLEALGAMFKLHRLALEDVVNTGQRPKIEKYDNHLFVVIDLPVIGSGSLRLEQISLFLGDNSLGRTE